VVADHQGGEHQGGIAVVTLPRRARRAFGRQHLFCPLLVFQQPAAGEPEEMESKFRILEIERAHFIIGQRQYAAGFDALDRLRPVIARRQQSEFAEDLAGLKLDVPFDHEVFAGLGQEHFVGKVALVKENVALAIFPPFHVGPQPIHRQVGARRDANLLDQRQHLIEADRMHRQQQRIKRDGRQRPRQQRGPQQTEGAHQARDAQWDRGLHRHRHDIEKGAGGAQRVVPCDEAHHVVRGPVVHLGVSSPASAGPQAYQSARRLPRKLPSRWRQGEHDGARRCVSQANRYFA
jgi:hypothetical protein